MKIFSKIIEKRMAVMRYAFFVTAINFVIYILLSFFLGGDAFNGEIAEGKYMLGGGYFAQQEENIIIWYFSYIYSIFLFISFGFILFFGFLIIMKKIHDITKKKRDR